MALDKSESLLSYNFSPILKVESLNYVRVHFINTAAISPSTSLKSSNKSWECVAVEMQVQGPLSAS